MAAASNPLHRRRLRRLTARACRAPARRRSHRRREAVPRARVRGPSGLLGQRALPGAARSRAPARPRPAGPRALDGRSPHRRCRSRARADRRPPGRGDRPCRRGTRSRRDHHRNTWLRPGAGSVGSVAHELLHEAACPVDRDPRGGAGPDRGRSAAGPRRDRSRVTPAANRGIMTSPMSSESRYATTTMPRSAGQGAFPPSRARRSPSRTSIRMTNRRRFRLPSTPPAA